MGKSGVPEVVIEAKARFYRSTVRNRCAYRLTSVSQARAQALGRCTAPTPSLAAPFAAERALLLTPETGSRSTTCRSAASHTGGAKSTGTTLKSCTTRWSCATATSSRASRFRRTAPGATIQKRCRLRAHTLRTLTGTAHACATRHAT